MIMQKDIDKYEIRSWKYEGKAQEKQNRNKNRSAKDSPFTIHQ